MCIIKGDFAESPAFFDKSGVDEEWNKSPQLAKRFPSLGRSMPCRAFFGCVLQISFVTNKTK
jgi:hypothetical protein